MKIFASHRLLSLLLLSVAWQLGSSQAASTNHESNGGATSSTIQDRITTFQKRLDGQTDKLQERQVLIDAKDDEIRRLWRHLEKLREEKVTSRTRKNHRQLQDPVCPSRCFLQALADDLNAAVTSLNNLVRVLTRKTKCIRALSSAHKLFMSQCNWYIDNGQSTSVSNGLGNLIIGGGVNKANTNVVGGSSHVIYMGESNVGTGAVGGLLHGAENTIEANYASVVAGTLHEIKNQIDSMRLVCRLPFTYPSLFSYLFTSMYIGFDNVLSEEYSVAISSKQYDCPLEEPFEFVANFDSSTDTCPICFTTNAELRSAVTNYIDNPGPTSTAAQTYGYPINKWCVGDVTDFSQVFVSKTSFNEYIGDWDVQEATTMAQMFRYAHSFNQDINSWNIGKVTSLAIMFSESGFNQPLDQWDTSKVETTSGMFCLPTSSFNQDLSSWNLTSMLDMSIMFVGANFNQNLCAGWGPQLQGTAINVFKMFWDVSGGCAFTADPNLSADPVTPLCFDCSPS